MNSAAIANLLMSGSALIVAGAGGVRWMLGHRSRTAQENREQQDSSSRIQLSRTQREQVVEEAGKIYSDKRIEIERWWLEQFQLVQKQLTEERETEAARWARFRKAVKAHKAWDDEQLTTARARGENPRPAPSLDFEDYRLDED